MRKSLIILIIASAILLSVVESKKHIRKQTTDEIRGVPILIGSGLESSTTTNAPTPTYYTKANTKCINACEASGGNSFNYYQYNRYLCCDIGLTGYGDGWYSMYCYALVLNCQGD